MTPAGDRNQAVASWRVLKLPVKAVGALTKHRSQQAATWLKAGRCGGTTAWSSHRPSAPSWTRASSTSGFVELADEARPESIALAAKALAPLMLSSNN